jgi:hypothetical protein
VNVIEILEFAVAAIVFAILGIAFGGTFLFLINDENITISDKIEMLSIYIIPPVVILCSLAVYYLVFYDPVLPALGWGVITGMVSGITCTYLLRRL